MLFFFVYWKKSSKFAHKRNVTIKYYKMLNDIDISEDYIFSLSPKLLSLLLIDHTTSTAEKQHNIFWATNDYENLGEGYSYHDEITIENITGEHNYIIQPRRKKK